jgi:hypothetical protein
MNTEYKYVVDDMGGCSIFPPYIQHSDVSHLHAKRGLSSIVGAGFLEISDGEVQCFGKAVSLNIRSRGEEDAVIVAEHLGLTVG